MLDKIKQVTSEYDQRKARTAPIPRARLSPRRLPAPRRRQGGPTAGRRIINPQARLARVIDAYQRVQKLRQAAAAEAAKAAEAEAAEG